MSFAVVELKYMPKKTFIVPISWIKHYSPNKHAPTIEFYCYISCDLKDAPDFRAKYYMKFNGTAGLFKVFILKVTDSIIDAVSYQEQKRVKSIPQKFRQPANTEAELKAENAQRKKKINIVQKKAKKFAKEKNMAHLAAALGNANVTALMSTPEIDTYTTDDSDSEDSLTDTVPNGARFPATTDTPQNERQVLDPTDTQLNGLQVFTSTDTPTNGGQILAASDSTLIDGQVIASTEGPRNVGQMFETVESSQAIAVPIEIDIRPEDAQVFNARIRNDAMVVPINFSEIVRQALEGVDCDVDFGEALNFDLNEFYGVNNASTHDGVEDTTQAIIIDVPLNGGDSQVEKEQTITQSVINSSSVSTASTLALPKHKDCEVVHSSTMLGHDSVEEINYREAYLKLKQQNTKLDERNVALQNALVAADKALGKVPQVPYTEKDGGRLYKEGVFLNEIQCKILDATSDNNKFVNNLVVAVFGTDALKSSSVTGTASKNKRLPAKPALHPLWLQLVYDLTDAKTNKRMSKSDINKIINKKMSNLNGAEKRRLAKLNGNGTGGSDVTEDTTTME